MMVDRNWEKEAMCCFTLGIKFWFCKINAPGGVFYIVSIDIRIVLNT